MSEKNIIMKFTPEEICLFKLVAERYIKEVKYGEWYLLNNKQILCAYANKGFHKYLEKKDEITPLWTISDCLELLNKHGWNAVTLSWRMEQEGDKPEIAYCEIIHDNFYEAEDKKVMSHVKDFEAKTLLEGCLKAVVAVLEEDK